MTAEGKAARPAATKHGSDGLSQPDAHVLGWLAACGYRYLAGHRGVYADLYTVTAPASFPATCSLACWASTA